jgi:hypothetical protein
MNAENETRKHIEEVRNYLNKVIIEVLFRQERHDQSKLGALEAEVFEEYTPKLRDSVYGSPEYKKLLEEMKPALDHHYTVNRHHPEHFKRYVCIGCHKEYKTVIANCDMCGYSQFEEEPDVSQMNLIDILEMLCDWKAATLRHATGDILKSVEINQKRFGYSDELKQILLNTVESLSLKQKGG